uniref:Uncharacterized protein n=1 Tax=Cuerna arida TaxID=1464854 RepID=A0A1B6F0Y4_9HEMI
MVESAVRMSFSTAKVMYYRSLLLLALFQVCCGLELEKSTTGNSVLYQSDFIPPDELCFLGLPSLLCSIRCHEMSQKPYCDVTKHRCKCGSSMDMNYNTGSHHILDISSLPMFSPNLWTPLDRSQQSIQHTRNRTISHTDHLSPNASAGTAVDDSPEKTHRFTFFSFIDFGKIFGFNSKNDSSSKDVGDIDTLYSPVNSTENVTYSSGKIRHDWSTETYMTVLAVILLCLLLLLLVSYYCKKRKDQKKEESIFKTVNISSNK